MPYVFRGVAAAICISLLAIAGCKKESSSASNEGGPQKTQLLLDWKPSLFRESLDEKLHRYLFGALAIVAVLAATKALEVAHRLPIDPRVSDRLLAAIDQTGAGAGTTSAPAAAVAQEPSAAPAAAAPAPDATGRRSLPSWLNPPPLR